MTKWTNRIKEFYQRYPKSIIVLCGVFCLFLLTLIFFIPEKALINSALTYEVIPRSFSVNVSAKGVLLADRSHIVTASLKGDQMKIIEMIPDGTQVNSGDILVKFDPTPFEDALNDVLSRIEEQKSFVAGLKVASDWEEHQVQAEKQAHAFELELANLDLNHFRDVEGPQEIERLKLTHEKTRRSYESLKTFMGELSSLEDEGWLNPTEKQQANKKFHEAKEKYLEAEEDYQSYANHIYPMRLKKLEMAYKKAEIKKEELKKSGQYRLAKCRSALDQAEKTLLEYQNRYQFAQRELDQTALRAPIQGMVVFRNEYRGGQKRKPLIGDLIHRNQPICELPDLSSMIVQTKIRENDLCKIGIGKSALVTVEAYPDLKLKGTVRSIGVLALPDSYSGGDEKFFSVTIDLDHSPSNLRPGMTTRVTIHANEISNCVALPIQSIKEEEDAFYCFVKNGKDFEKREIIVGDSNEYWIEVAEGLSAGEIVSLLVSEEA